jgi:hypothetical protein
MEPKAIGPAVVQIASDAIRGIVDAMGWDLEDPEAFRRNQEKINDWCKVLDLYAKQFK